MKFPDSISPSNRRLFAVVLMLLGVLLMFLAPETWARLILLVLGASIEIAGMVLGHRDGR